MLISPNVVITQLKSNCPLVKSFGGSADFAAAQAALKNKMPAVYVVPLAESARPNSSATTVVQQMVNQQFGVIIACSNLRDATGEKTLADLHQVRQQVMSTLMGWVPPGVVNAMEFSGGQLMDMDDQVVWWQDTFNVDIHLRSA